MGVRDNTMHPLLFKLALLLYYNINSGNLVCRI
jgi:hypothetical protein